MKDVKRAGDREGRKRKRKACSFVFQTAFSFYCVCARLAQLVRSLTANPEVPGSVPGLVEG